MKAQILLYDSELRKYVNCVKMNPCSEISDTTGKKIHAHFPPFLHFKCDKMCKLHNSVNKLNGNKFEK